MGLTLELELAWEAVAHVAGDGRRARMVRDDLIGRYRQPHRRYHGARHVVWVLRHISELGGSADTPGPVDMPVAIAAAFFHDAVYEPAADDNERRSARLAATQLASCSWPAERITAVTEIVEATAAHLDPVGIASLSPTTAVVLDADIAILGADASAYQAYVRGVRAEYGHLTDDAWRRGRRAVVAALLERTTLYRTSAASRRWDAIARANLAAELASLDQ